VWVVGLNGVSHFIPPPPPPRLSEVRKYILISPLYDMFSISLRCAERGYRSQ
jgi:hypothetical protein